MAGKEVGDAGDDPRIGGTPKVSLNQKPETTHPGQLRSEMGGDGPTCFHQLSGSPVG